MLTVLRLNHRRGRDARLSTHVGLIARALGANKIIYSGEHDQKLLTGIREVSKKWGGNFTAAYSKNWKKVLQEHKQKGFFTVHLTVYGIPIQKSISRIRKNKNILVIIGGKKVPGEVYELADKNLAVTNQPHSEAGSLAVFLHEYFKGKELNKKFSNPELKIIPQEKGKLIK